MKPIPDGFPVCRAICSKSVFFAFDKWFNDMMTQIHEIITEGDKNNEMLKVKKNQIEQYCFGAAVVLTHSDILYIFEINAGKLWASSFCGLTLYSYATYHVALLLVVIAHVIEVGEGAVWWAWGGGGGIGYKYI